MELQQLNPNDIITLNGPAEKQYRLLQNLLHALQSRELPEQVTNELNLCIARVNEYSGPANGFQKVITKARADMTGTLEKKAGLVPKGYYRNLWLALGMSSIGIPLGVLFGLALKNMAFIGIGLPIGLGIGVAIGTAKDKKAEEEGRQLDITA